MILVLPVTDLKLLLEAVGFAGKRKIQDYMEKTGAAMEDSCDNDELHALANIAVNLQSALDQYSRGVLGETTGTVQ